MSDVAREDRLLDVFVQLSDTLADDFDAVELLQVLVEACQTTFDVAAVALLLDGGAGELELIASTDEASETVELLVLAAEEGPCIDAFESGAPVSVPDLREGEGWPEFRSQAIGQGFSGVHALPMRLREESIGALSLFDSAEHTVDDRDLRAAQALADVTTIGILQERAVRANRTVKEQLQAALDSRVVIEQAKGVIAYTHDESMEDAFARLRAHARSAQRPLTEIAQAVVDRQIIV